MPAAHLEERGITVGIRDILNKEIILFGLDFFRGYLFCNVHTYTVSEFQKNKLTQWENEKSLPLNKS